MNKNLQIDDAFPAKTRGHCSWNVWEFPNSVCTEIPEKGGWALWRVPAHWCPAATPLLYSSTLRVQQHFPNYDCWSLRQQVRPEQKETGARPWIAKGDEWEESSSVVLLHLGARMCEEVYEKIGLLRPCRDVHSWDLCGAAVSRISPDGPVAAWLRPLAWRFRVRIPGSFPCNGNKLVTFRRDTTGCRYCVLQGPLSRITYRPAYGGSQARRRQRYAKVVRFCLHWNGVVNCGIESKNFPQKMSKLLWPFILIGSRTWEGQKSHTSQTNLHSMLLKSKFIPSLTSSCLTSH